MRKSKRMKRRRMKKTDEEKKSNAASGEGAPKDSDSKKGATPRSNTSKRPSVTSKTGNKTPPRTPPRSPRSNNSKKSGGSKK